MLNFIRMHVENQSQCMQKITRTGLYQILYCTFYFTVHHTSWFMHAHAGILCELCKFANKSPNLNTEGKLKNIRQGQWLCIYIGTIWWFRPAKLIRVIVPVTIKVVGENLWRPFTSVMLNQVFSRKTPCLGAILTLLHNRENCLAERFISGLISGKVFLVHFMLHFI